MTVIYRIEDFAMDPGFPCMVWDPAFWSSSLMDMRGISSIFFCLDFSAERHWNLSPVF